MTGEQSLVLRGAISVAMGAATIVSWKFVPGLTLARDTFFKLFLALFTLSRLGLFLLAYPILHLTPRGDILLYMNEAVPAFMGKLVYRDFFTPHAPLSPYLMSSMLHLHYSPLTIMFFGNLFDLCAMAVWFKAAQEILPSLTLRRAALLILFNPTSLLTEAIDGQMNSFIALFLGLAVYALVKHKDLLSGTLVAVPAAVIKFIALIYAPGFVFAARRKVWATAGFVAVLLAVYVPFGFAGAKLLMPVSAEGTHETSSNLVYLFEFATGHSLGLHLPDALLGLSWLAVVVTVFFCMRAVAGSSQNERADEERRRMLHMLVISLIAELLCIQIFSKNTWDRYLVMTMPALCILAAEFSFTEIIAFGIWAADVSFEPSYWATKLQLPTSAIARSYLLRGDEHLYRLMVFEVVCVAGNCFLLYACIRALLHLRRPRVGVVRMEVHPAPRIG
jgi:hypothetical protein